MANRFFCHNLLDEVNGHTFVWRQVFTAINRQKAKIQERLLGAANLLIYLFFAPVLCSERTDVILPRLLAAIIAFSTIRKLDGCNLFIQIILYKQV